MVVEVDAAVVLWWLLLLQKGVVIKLNNKT